MEAKGAGAEKGRWVMIGRDLLEHPDFAERMVGFKSLPFPGCVGPLSYRDRASLDRDLAHLAAAVAARKPHMASNTPPPPGFLTRVVITAYSPPEAALLQPRAALQVVSD